MNDSRRDFVTAARVSPVTWSGNKNMEITFSSFLCIFGDKEGGERFAS